MNVLSLFDGISSGRIALDRAGIKVDNYFSSEIKEDALKVTRHNWPSNIELGDVTKIDCSVLPKIDLLIGGSPCQNFSRANKSRKGLQGDKSKLFYEYVRILNEVKPKYFLLENVVMPEHDRVVINKELGVEPIRINSSLVSAALRDRLYWTNIPGVTVPQDKGIVLQSIITSGYVDRAKARTLLESDSRPLSNPAKMCRRYLMGFTTLVFEKPDKYEYIIVHPRTLDKYKSNLISMNTNCRYMNQTELERCMTLPEGYTSVLDRNHAAGVIGDGWTVDVISHIFKNI